MEITVRDKLLVPAVIFTYLGIISKLGIQSSFIITTGFIITLMITLFHVYASNMTKVSTEKENTAGSKLLDPLCLVVNCMSFFINYCL